MEEAAGCYERAAEQYEITKSAHESARAYVEAAKCRKAVAPASAVDAFGKVYNWSTLYEFCMIRFVIGGVHTGRGHHDLLDNYSAPRSSLSRSEVGPYTCTVSPPPPPAAVSEFPLYCFHRRASESCRDLS